jgi:hypothetical protein
MTNDPAKQETFRSHLPVIVAATAGTVLAAILGSLMGVAGTVAGMAIGSVVSGTCSWWAERGIRRSAAIAAARADAIRARGELRPGEDAAITLAAATRHDRARPRRRWAGPAAIAAAAFIGCAVPVTLLEHAVGKPLSALVDGKPGRGTTLGGGVSGGPAPASPAPAPSAGTTGPAATTPASSTTPSRASSSPAASPTPAATTPGSTPPVSSTPHSAVPSATATAPVPGPSSSSARSTPLSAGGSLRDAAVPP